MLIRAKFSRSLVLNIMKLFKRWRVKDLLKLLGDVMKYLIIEDRKLDSVRMKLQDVKMSNLEYYIANVNPQGCPKTR